jgi:hypothetical protein
MVGDCCLGIVAAESGTEMELPISTDGGSIVSIFHLYGAGLKRPFDNVGETSKFE